MKGQRKLTGDKWIEPLETAAHLSGEHRRVSLLVSPGHSPNCDVLDYLSLSRPAPLSVGHPSPVAAHRLAGCLLLESNIFVSTSDL